MKRSAAGIWIPSRRDFTRALLGVGAGALIQPAHASAPRLLVHTAKGTTSSGGTSTAIDTTGASLLITYVAGDSANYSDSKGNTWTALTTQSAGGPANCILRYCFNPIVGSGHTITTTAPFGSIYFAGFVGCRSIESQNGFGNASGTTTIQPGSVTPLAPGDLIVTGLANVPTSGSCTIDSGFTIIDFLNTSGGTYYGGALAYLIAPNLSAVNPIWTTIANSHATSIAAIRTANRFGGNS